MAAALLPAPSLHAPIGPCANCSLQPLFTHFICPALLPLLAIHWNSEGHNPSFCRAPPTPPCLGTLYINKKVQSCRHSFPLPPSPATDSLE